MKDKKENSVIKNNEIEEKEIVSQAEIELIKKYGNWKTFENLLVNSSIEVAIQYVMRLKKLHEKDLDIKTKNDGPPRKNAKKQKLKKEKVKV